MTSPAMPSLSCSSTPAWPIAGCGQPAGTRWRPVGASSATTPAATGRPAFGSRGRIRTGATSSTCSIIWASIAPPWSVSRGERRSRSTPRSNSPTASGRWYPSAPRLSGFDGGATSAEQAAFEEMERLEEARDWDALSELEAQFWVDGPGQPSDRIPDVHRRAREMIVHAYREHADEPLEDVTPLQPPPPDGWMSSGCRSWSSSAISTRAEPSRPRAGSSTACRMPARSRCPAWHTFSPWSGLTSSRGSSKGFSTASRHESASSDHRFRTRDGVRAEGQAGTDSRATPRIRSTSRVEATRALMRSIFSVSAACVLTSRSWTSEATV